ncbi:unnamed protein product [Pneumocystis jirovecii]|uniref:Uncharacterized protein n=1 Tax=Pneumocystis jirovecii TaxID=42068 RepID=L0P9I7_PNEJI|nr:unnamed protein product [Pneumocystis jirovecii]
MPGPTVSRRSSRLTVLKNSGGKFLPALFYSPVSLIFPVFFPPFPPLSDPSADAPQDIQQHRKGLPASPKERLPPFQDGCPPRRPPRRQHRRALAPYCINVSIATTTDASDVGGDWRDARERGRQRGDGRRCQYTQGLCAPRPVDALHEQRGCPPCNRVCPVLH